MTLVLHESSNFIINSGTSILVNLSLHNARSWMRGVYKGDSCLFLCRVKNEMRKFRVQFASERNKSSCEACRDCCEILSKIFHVKNCSDTNHKDKTKDMVFTDSMSIGEMTQVLTGSLTASLPLAYQQTNIPTQELSKIVRLCLTDSNFPAFVAEVQRELDTISKGKSTEENGLIS